MQPVCLASVRKVRDFDVWRTGGQRPGTWVVRPHVAFFQLWEKSGQQNYSYTAEDVSSYQEPQEMVELATILTGAPLSRLNKMRALRPM